MEVVDGTGTVHAKASGWDEIVVDPKGGNPQALPLPPSNADNTLSKDVMNKRCDVSRTSKPGKPHNMAKKNSIHGAEEKCHVTPARCMCCVGVHYVLHLGGSSALL